MSSSPVIADEEEDDSNAEWVKKRIVELEAGLAVLKTQVNHPKQAKIFLNSMKAQNIGGDLAAMGSDVRRFTETGTVRTTTHAQKVCPIVNNIILVRGHSAKDWGTINTASRHLKTIYREKKATPESLCTGGNGGKMFADRSRVRVAYISRRDVQMPKNMGGPIWKSPKSRGGHNRREEVGGKLARRHLSAKRDVGDLRHGHQTARHEWGDSVFYRVYAWICALAAQRASSSLHALLVHFEDGIHESSRVTDRVKIRAAVLRRMKAFHSRIIPTGCWETDKIVDCRGKEILGGPEDGLRHSSRS
ncbi:hypothetical protein B0H13DRAFT_1855200 [Mycena leptocephala]|nr:hypothetical protein B0H13DRAFT_1855200 [Mycena leptocephala]